MPHDNKTLTAVTLTIVNSVLLLWLGQIVYLTATFHNLSMLIPYDPYTSLPFYMVREGYVMSLPSFLLFITITASVTCFLLASIYLQGSKAKIRQLLLLSIISSLVIAYTYALLELESELLNCARLEVTSYEEEEEPDEYEMIMLRRLKKIIHQYEQN